MAPIPTVTACYDQFPLRIVDHTTYLIELDMRPIENRNLECASSQCQLLQRRGGIVISDPSGEPHLVQRVERLASARPADDGCCQSDRTFRR